MKTSKWLWLCGLCLAYSTAFAAPCDTIITEPKAGTQPILQAINAAKSQINLVIYGFTQQSLRKALVHAKQHGVTVNVILEQAPYQDSQENRYTRHYLQQYHIAVRSGNSRVALTHQKSMIIDNKQAWIMTFNFTYPAFSDQRNFAYVSCNNNTIREMNSLFYQDWNDQAVRAFNPKLIWSPINARSTIESLIRDAKHSLQMYALSLSDYQVVGLLAQAARRGVNVTIILPQQHNKLTRREKRYLQHHYIHIHYLANTHAKVIIVDGEKAYLGSTNITQSSLDKNRELGIILHNPELVAVLTHQFQRDLQ